MLLLLQTDQIAKAKALFEEIKAGHGGYLTDINLTEIQLAIYKSSHEYTKALATIERLIGFLLYLQNPRGHLRSTRQLRARL